MDLGHITETVLSSTVPIFIFMWANRKNAKADNDKKHEENQKAIANINAERRYLPAHGHAERTGPLCAEGITRGPDLGNR
jgi:hypothetical protein